MDKMLNGRLTGRWLTRLLHCRAMSVEGVLTSVPPAPVPGSAQDPAPSQKQCACEPAHPATARFSAKSPVSLVGLEDLLLQTNSVQGRRMM